MVKLTLYYATNRRHKGRDRFQPTSYGTDFSGDGMENLRFGKVTVEADADTLEKHLAADVGFGAGDGNALAGYLSKRAKSSRTAKIRAFTEKIDQRSAGSDPNQKLGSRAMFDELQQIMLKSRDVLIFVHGYNVAWNEAVGSALALQEVSNLGAAVADRRRLTVVLFTWPSDGSTMPFAAYKSDRSDAIGSGHAIGRGFLKLRDFLFGLRSVAGDAVGGAQICQRELHLLCHSMGNFVLENALARLAEFSMGATLPGLFTHVFLCAPDVDDEVLESDRPMGRLHEITRSVSVYFNRGDLALRLSDFTKGNPDRLGSAGVARPAAVHSKIQQIDCSPIVGGVVEHSYFLDGFVNEDIRRSIAGVDHDDVAGRPHRRSSGSTANSWVMKNGG